MGGRVSFKRNWNNVVRNVGYKHAHHFIDLGIGLIKQALDLDELLVRALDRGIITALSEGQGALDAGAMFGFAQRAANLVESPQVVGLTDYALTRFEAHIPADFGDGEWDEWLEVPPDVQESIAGFIWSALGSPHADTRWRACHVIRKLADFQCTPLLKAIVQKLYGSGVGAYGHKQFPFYLLHAKQYLLIALSRVSVDHAALLVPYSRVFISHAQGQEHLLIQKFAADTALNIEQFAVGTYGEFEIAFFRQVGRSAKETLSVEFGYRTESYLHREGHVATAEFSGAYDFDRYWYEPLGKLFGVSSNQIAELCGEVVKNEWKLETETGYYRDPRVELWNNNQGQITHHSHGNYPKTDNWAFYISYHSLMTVASKLLVNMPLINFRSSYTEEWQFWLSTHLLTMHDGKWLADHRGKLPLEIPSWIDEGGVQVWREGISDQYFLDCLVERRNETPFIHVRGHWAERHQTLCEFTYATTALVSKQNIRSAAKSTIYC